MFEIFQTARREGLVALEAHIEEPEKSAIFQKYPGFNHHHQARAFLCDTLKVLLTGAVEDHNLAEILDLDLERQHEEEHAVATAVTKVGDAMPGFGIVAAVLGVVITMGSIGGAASEIGEKVAAALVGTFLGVLLAYGLINPWPAPWKRAVAPRARTCWPSGRRCSRSPGATPPSRASSSPGGALIPPSAPRSANSRA